MSTSLLIRSDLRIIDRQESQDSDAHRVVELFNDPTGRKVRFDACIRPKAPRYSSAHVCVWDGHKWQRLHSLLEPGTDPAVAITLLFATTGELLDWPKIEEAA